MTEYNIDIELLRLIRTRDNYDKYRHLIKDYACLAETNQLVKDMGTYFKKHPLLDEIEWADFTVWSRLHEHPAWKNSQHDMFETITNTVGNKAAEDDTVAKFLELEHILRIKSLCEDLINGSSKSSNILFDIEEVASAYRSLLVDSSSDTMMVDMELEGILEEIISTGGVEWRLEDLNRSVGSVHPGDFIIIGKRPEVGGTTFLTSEITHMVTQLPEGKNAIIFNNEERGEKVGARVIQSALGLTVFDLAADVHKSQADYRSVLGTKKVDVAHSTSLSTRDVERKLRTEEYGIVGINVLDKIQGFYKMEGVERTRRIAQWAREIADKYDCVVMAVAQADASAEGQKWLNQSQLYGSKTGVQGEADALLMIGASHDPGDEHRRFISVCKNKLPGGGRADPTLRRGKHEVEFDGERARFVSLAY